MLILIGSSMNLSAQTAKEFGTIWDEGHISNKFPSDVRHSDLKVYIEQLRKIGVSASEVGKSGAGREIYQLEFGSGPLKVFLWSQMHGDEPTATSALIDLFAYLEKNKSEPGIKDIAAKLTLRAVPMLNPDGAEGFTRVNLQNLDINRDAVKLRTPEARLLKELHNAWHPNIGFNLHNQKYLTTVGPTNAQASVSLLVVYGDAAKTTNDGIERNKRLAAAMVRALEQFIPGHIARYDDEYTASAFGDNFTAWGTPVILVETGGLYGKDESFLVKINFVAYMTALRALATGSEKNEDPGAYLTLHENSSGGLVNFVFRSASVGGKNVDIAGVTERTRASAFQPVRIRSVGNIGKVSGLEEYDASGFNVVPRFSTLKPGELMELLFYRTARSIDLNAAGLEGTEPPDAIFSGGKWLKGEGVVPRK